MVQVNLTTPEKSEKTIDTDSEEEEKPGVKSPILNKYRKINKESES